MAKRFIAYATQGKLVNFSFDSHDKATGVLGTVSNVGEAIAEAGDLESLEQKAWAAVYLGTAWLVYLTLVAWRLYNEIEAAVVCTIILILALLLTAAMFMQAEKEDVTPDGVRSAAERLPRREVSGGQEQQLQSKNSFRFVLQREPQPSLGIIGSEDDLLPLVSVQPRPFQ